MGVQSAIMDAIRVSAASSATEICGALLGSGKRVQELVPLSNESHSRVDSFYIPAGVLLHLERAAEARGLHVVGFYHSHPNGDAIPSSTDLDQALPGYIYLIAARNDLRAWQLRDDRSGFDEVSLADRDDS